MPDRSQPGSEMRPNQIPFRRREQLEHALRDHSGLNVAMICSDLALHLFPVALGFSMEMLIPAVSLYLVHRLHPKMILVGPERVYRLLEGYFDLEAVAVEFGYAFGVHFQIRSHQQDTPPLWMVDQHEERLLPGGLPEQLGAPVDRRKGALRVQASLHGDCGHGQQVVDHALFSPVFSRTAPPFWAGLGLGRQIRDGLFLASNDQMMALRD